MKPLAALLLAALAASTCGDPPDPRGRWTGYLLPPFDALPIGLDVTAADGGALTGVFLAPDYGYPSVPLGEVRLAGDTLVAALGGRLSFVAFEGRLRGDLFEGEFHEGGGSTPFALARVGTATGHALDAWAACRRSHDPGTDCRAPAP